MGSEPEHLMLKPTCKKRYKIDSKLHIITPVIVTPSLISWNLRERMFLSWNLTPLYFPPLYHEFFFTLMQTVKEVNHSLALCHMSRNSSCAIFWLSCSLHSLCFYLKFWLLKQHNLVDHRNTSCMSFVECKLPLFVQFMKWFVKGLMVAIT